MKLLSLLLLLSMSAQAGIPSRFGDINVGNTAVIGSPLSSAPLAGAMLEADSTTAGFLPPRMTTTQRNAISSPPTGLVVYNTTTNALNVYNGASWVSAGGGSISFALDTGTANTYAIAPVTAATAYAAGDSYSFLSLNANTGASTLNVSGLGTKAIKVPAGGAVVSGDILAAQIVTVVYDGTNFQMISPQGPAVSANTANTTVKRDASGNFVAGTVTAALTGTAANATNAATVASTTNASFFPLFAASSTNGNQPFNLGAGLTFNPSTNALSTTTFIGALTGVASGNTSYNANHFGLVYSGTTNAMSVLAPSASTAFPLVSGGVSAAPAWSLLTVAGGGTGLATLTSGSVIIGAGTGTPTGVAPGTTGNVLQSSGGAWVSAAAAASATMQGQSDGSTTTLAALQVPNHQATTTGTNTSLIETGNNNMLANPSFEASTVGSGWTTGTGATGSASTSKSVAGGGLQSINLTLSSTSAAETLLYQDVTPVNAMPGVNGEASLWVNTTQSGLQVCPRAAGVTIVSASTCASVLTDGTWHQYPVNFIYPSSGSVGVGLYSALAITGPSIAYGDVGYVGIARNLAQVSQAQWLGKVTITGCAASWSTASLTIGNFSAASGCIYAVSGALQAPSTQIPGFVIPSVGPGVISIRTTGVMLSSAGTGGSAGGYFQFSDGTNTFNPQMSYVSASGSTADSIYAGTLGGDNLYSLPQSNLTLQIQGAAWASGQTTAISVSTLPLVFNVYYFPSQAQTVYSAANGGLSAGDITSTGATSCPIGTIAANGASLTTAGYPALYASIGYTYGGSGANFTVPDLRGIFARGAGTNGSLTESNGGSFSATQGTYQNDQFQGHIHANNVGIGSGSGTSVPSAYANQSVTSNGSNTTVAGSLSDGTNGGPRLGAETRPASLGVLYCIRTVPATPAPVMAGNVTSTTAGQLHAEYAYLTSTTCAVESLPGNGWISAVSHPGTGQCTITIATGEFSGKPHCSCDAANTSFSCVPDLTTVSGTLATFITRNSGTLTDSENSIVCVGPR